MLVAVYWSLTVFVHLLSLEYERSDAVTACGARAVLNCTEYYQLATIFAVMTLLCSPCCRCTRTNRFEVVRLNQHYLPNALFHFGYYYLETIALTTMLVHLFADLCLTVLPYL